jgi:hypothetical protein
MPATALVLPPQPVPVVQAGGLVTLPWRSSLQNALNNLQTQITALAALEGDTEALDTALSALQAEVDAAEASIAAHIADTANPHATTAVQVGADPAGTAAAAVAAHVALADPHTQYLTEAAATASYQPLDATLIALAAQNWALNALPIGTGADTVSQVAFAANTFPARASTGDLVAKTVTDGALSAVGGTGGTAGMLRGDGTVTSQLETVGAEQSFTLRAYASLTRLAAERYNGTVGTPTAILNGQNLFAFTMRGYNSSALVESGGIQFVSTENWAVGAHGMQCIVRTTSNGAASPTTRWSWTHDGNYTPSADNAYSFGTVSLRVASDHVVQRNTSGAEYQTGIQSPAQFVANTDNFALTSTTRILRCSTDASRNLTGITGGESGRRLTLSNVGAQNLVLVHDATSTAANRFLCPGSANLTINANDSADLWYDATSSRWRVIGV